VTEFEQFLLTLLWVERLNRYYSVDYVIYRRWGNYWVCTIKDNVINSNESILLGDEFVFTLFKRKKYLINISNELAMFRNEMLGLPFGETR
jgi:hypothetical protein